MAKSMFGRKAAFWLGPAVLVHQLLLAMLANAAPVSADVCANPAAPARIVVNVRDPRFHAAGDGVADDTAAIQSAISAVQGRGGVVRIPAGVYAINPVAKPYSGPHGLEIRAAVTLSMSPGAVLKAIGTSSDYYAVVMIFPGAENVRITGGVIEGERVRHKGEGGEFGVGLSIIGARNVVVKGTTSRDSWGDGFYVDKNSANIAFCGVTADHNRRNGLSIVSVSGMRVENSTFQNSVGTAPELGLDIEPDAGKSVSDVEIRSSRFIANAGGGFQTGVEYRLTGTASVRNVVFDGNTVSRNGLHPLNYGYAFAIQVANQSGAVITNNVIKDNIGEGVRLTGSDDPRTAASYTNLSRNVVTGTVGVPGHPFWTGGGIYLANCPHSTVRDNTVSGNEGNGIVASDGTLTGGDDTIELSGNKVFGNGRTP